MDATNRIVEEFNRFVALGRDQMLTLPHQERVVFFIVATRCEIDMEGFASVFEQALSQTELAILIAGLQGIGEQELSAEFARGLEMLVEAGYYEHLN